MSTEFSELSGRLSKEWIPQRAIEPFYSGGPVRVAIENEQILSEKRIAERSESEFHNDGASGEGLPMLVCVYDDNLAILKQTDKGIRKLEFLFDKIDADDEQLVDGIVHFCLNPTNSADVVVATKRCFLQNWNISTKSCGKTIKAHQMPISALSYDPSGTLVASGSADRTIKIWDVVNGHFTHSFKDHGGVIQTLRFHTNNRTGKLLLFSSSDDNSVRVHDLMQKKAHCIVTFSEHVSVPTQICATSDSSLIVSVGRDKVINFYSFRFLSHVKTVPAMEELESAVILSRPDAKRLLSNFSSDDLTSNVPTYVLATAGEKGIIKFYKFEMKMKDVSTFQIQLLCQLALSVTCARPISLLEYPEDASELWVVTTDHSIYSYGIERIETSIADSLESKEVTNLADTPITSEPKSLLIGSQGEILDIACAPVRKEGGRLRRELVLVTNSPHVRVLDTDALQCRYLEGHSDIVLSADVGPDGEWLVTSSKDRKCMVWHLPTARLVAVGEGHTDAVGCICTSRSKATYQSRAVFMFSGAGDKILKKWPLPVHSFLSSSQQSGKKDLSGQAVKLSPQYSIRAHDKDINCVSLSPNDALLASCSQDKSIRLWNTGNLTPVATLNGHKRGVWRVQFSPVDKVLASCSGDRTLKLWSVSDYSCLRTFDGNTASVLCVAFVNKGTQLISGSADGLVRLWTVRTGECENTFDRHMDKIWAITTLEKHRSLESAGDGGEDVGAATLPVVEGGCEEGRGVDYSSMFASGGSDSRVLFWRDVTAEEEDKKTRLREETLLLEQQLTNHIRNRNFAKAFTLALDLGHYSKLLSIISAILDDDDSGKKIPSLSNGETGDSLARSFSGMWYSKLDPYIAALSDEQIEKLVGYVNEWNMNAKHCFVSQVVLSCVIRVVGAERLVAMRKLGQVLPGLLAYSERHHSRISKIRQATYLLDYVSSLVSLQPLPEKSDSNSNTGKRHYDSLLADSKGKQEEADAAPVLFKVKTKKLKAAKHVND